MSDVNEGGIRQRAKLEDISSGERGRGAIQNVTGQVRLDAARCLGFKGAFSRVVAVSVPLQTA